LRTPHRKAPILLLTEKNWDHYVVSAEEVARSDGFTALRDEILALASPRPTDVVVDIGAGTGLLTLAIAPAVERIWAVDISRPMCDYLSAKAASAGYDNVEIVTASAISLPLADACADVVVSNYCLHHLGDDDKRRALNEVFRVLRPGGRFVFADMMFRVSLAEPRDRRVVATKVRRMLRKGPPGVVRLAKNALRYATRRWEHPARVDWWQSALEHAGFVRVSVEAQRHEGGIAHAVRP
jgi:ubiquinone/menaquinone biosynthesis C-methylase UbiE